MFLGINLLFRGYFDYKIPKEKVWLFLSSRRVLGGADDEKNLFFNKKKSLDFLKHIKRKTCFLRVEQNRKKTKK